jgi:hypothetical protein
LDDRFDGSPSIFDEYQFGANHLEEVYGAHEHNERKAQKRKPRRRKKVDAAQSATIACEPKVRKSLGRPSLDDVLRLSKGQSTRSRAGSRTVPHRLNSDERQQFDLARKHGFLTVRGTGYRRRRKGSPITNIHRQLCDAQNRVVVRVEDCSVCIDFSTLRRPEEHSELRKLYLDFLDGAVEDQGRAEALLGVEFDDTEIATERGEAWQSLQIWLLPTAGMAVEMATRSDARHIAEALAKETAPLA